MNHEDRLVVLAEYGQCNVARLMVVQDPVHVLLMNLLHGTREVTPPALQELVRRLQFLLSLFKRLPKSPLIVERLGRRADDDGI